MNGSSGVDRMERAASGKNEGEGMERGLVSMM